MIREVNEVTEWKLTTAEFWTVLVVIALSVAKKQYLDILDADAGIYGRSYGITGGGIEFTVRSKELAGVSDLINVAAATAEKIPA